MNISIRILRPVGNPIIPKKRPLAPGNFGEFQIRFFQSGTAALAAALIGAKQSHQAINGTPEVLLPAYGCPDLVSACIYAGIKPILVDLEPDTCWTSLKQIELHITPQTIAVIAVRFLGIAERMEQLKQICQAHNLLLIEDSAQGFPVSKPEHYWHGDVIVLSFGRGKPINLLGGGALLLRNNKFSTDIPAPAIRKRDIQAKINYMLKVRTYNLLINPLVYGLASRLPGIKIGETVYKQLSSLEGIQDFRIEYLDANIRAYRNLPSVAVNFRDALDKLGSPDILNLPVLVQHDFQNPLLRYPLLFKDKEVRDQVFRVLAPYGASLMYQKALPAIETIPNQQNFVGLQFECADNFAGRLLTLPTHSGVNIEIINKIMSVLQETA